MRCSVLSCYRTACNSGLCDVHYVEGARTLPQRQVAVLDPEPEPAPAVDTPAGYEVFDRRICVPKLKRINVRHKQMRRIAQDLRDRHLVGPNEDHTFQVAMVLFMAFAHGQNPDRLSAVTGYDHTFVRTITERLVENGFWEDGSFVSEYDVDMPEFAVEVSLAILVGQGIVVRVPA